MEQTNIVNYPYALRVLCAKDIFPMTRILANIGLKEFSEAFQDGKYAALFQTGKADGNASAGMAVTLEIAQILLSNLHRCEQDLYSFLSGVSGIPKKEVAELPMDIFLQMVVETVRKPEFTDFFKAVSKLVK